MLITNKVNSRDILGTRVVSGTYNATIADVNFILKADTSGGAVTINLFNIGLLPTNSAFIAVVDDTGNAGTNNITINAFAGQTINGNASIVLDQNNASCHLDVVDNDKWFSAMSDIAIDKMVTVGVNYSVKPTDETVNMNVAGITATLPTAVGNTKIYEIKNSSNGNCFMTTTGGQTIEGRTPPVILEKGNCFTVQSDGSNYFII